MFIGTSTTICPSCGHQVRVGAHSFCQLCGEYFPQAVIARQITRHETDSNRAEQPELVAA